MGKSISHHDEEYWGILSPDAMKSRLKAAVEECELDEPRRRMEWADQKVKRDKRRKATFYPGGSLIKVSKLPGYDMYEGEVRGKRGKVRGFTDQARLRLLSTVATLDRNGGVPRFVTLTYPEVYPEDFQDWKKDLDTFAKRLARKHKGAAFLWKLEPQKRGAPHFHLLLWGVPFLDKEWLSRAWFEVVGSNDEKHLRAGTRVEFVRSWNGVMAYAGKNYMGKECEAPRNWPEFTGRYWGIYGRKAVPKSERVEVDMSYRGLVRVHRVLRRYMEKRGTKWRAGGGITLFHTDFRLWLRVFEWADEGFTHPVNHGVGLDKQPF